MTENDPMHTLKAAHKLEIDTLGRELIETRTLYEIAKIITQTLDLDTVLNRISEFIIDLFNAEKITIILLMENTLTVKYSTDPLLPIGLIVNDKSILTAKPTSPQLQVIQPLNDAGQPMGYLIVGNRKRDKPFLPHDLVFLSELAEQIAIVINNALAYAQVEQLAWKDAATGLYNRGYFFHRFPGLVELARRRNTSLAVIMIDIDFFKSINDQFGHPTGDRVLLKLGNIIQTTTQIPNALAARFGGEEFVIAIPDFNQESTHNLSETIRNEIAKTPFTSDEAEPFRVTISAGYVVSPDDLILSERNPYLMVETTNHDWLIYMADKALYHSKKAGRNCTVAYSTLKSSPPLLQRSSRIQAIRHQINSLLFISPELYQHSLRVGLICATLMQRITDQTDQLERAKTSGILHDIGKRHIPKSILFKPGSLTVDEFEIIKTHAELGGNAAENTNDLQDIAPIIRHHHERWDGSGYPDGIRGDAIELESRIIAIADSLDTLTSLRNYHAPITYEDALEKIVQQQNRMYDPCLVPILADCQSEIGRIQSRKWTIEEIIG